MLIIGTPHLGFCNTTEDFFHSILHIALPDIIFNVNECFVSTETNSNLTLIFDSWV